MTIFSCLPATGDEIVVLGTQTSVYKINTRSPHLFYNHVNNGFRQKAKKLGENLVEVSIQTGGKQLESFISYPLEYRIPKWLSPYLEPTPEIESTNPVIKQLAAKLTRKCSFQHQVVHNIVRWVNTNIEYDLSNDSPHSAIGVLNSKKAYCIGYSNLTLALLRASGIPCRNIHGIFFDRRSGLKKRQPYPLSLNSVTLHRWIEVYYPDVGWVFSDPRFSLNHVGSDYIFLSPQNGTENYRGELLNGTKVSLQDRVVNTEMVDMIEEQSNLLLVRPNIFRRFNSRIVVWLLNAPLPKGKYEVTLSNLDRIRRGYVDEKGKITFLGLENGEYEIKIRYNDSLKFIKKFALKKATEVYFDIKLDLEEKLE